MAKNKDTEEGEQRFNPAEEFMKRQQNSRMGQFPGVGPAGAQQYSYKQLPDDPDALKWMYLELQKTALFRRS